MDSDNRGLSANFSLPLGSAGFQSCQLCLGECDLATRPEGTVIIGSGRVAKCQDNIKKVHLGELAKGERYKENKVNTCAYYPV